MKKHWTSSIALGLFSAMAVVGCGEDTSGSPDAETTEQGSSSAVGDATDDGDSSGPGGPTSVSSSGPSSTTSTDGSDTDTGAGAGVPSGFYVWWRKVTEDGSGGYTVDQEITEEDMEWKVGPTGWPGCPNEDGSRTRFHATRVALPRAMPSEQGVRPRVRGLEPAWPAPTL